MHKNIFIIVGPSGVGKGTLVNKLLDEYPDFTVPTSYTTRPPRIIESKYKKYLFVSEAEFMQAVKDNKILEYERTHGILYGTDKKTIEDDLKEKKIIIADIDYRGAETYKSLWPNRVIVIFIRFSSMSSLKQRLMQDPARKDITQADIETRTKTAQKEMEYLPKADHVIINEDGKLDLAYNQLKQIISKYID